MKEVSIFREYRTSNKKWGEERRTFANDDFDIFIWYDNSGSKITSFRIVRKEAMEWVESFSWNENTGAVISLIDDESLRFSGTPLLGGTLKYLSHDFVTLLSKSIESLDISVRPKILEVAGPLLR